MTLLLILCKLVFYNFFRKVNFASLNVEFEINLKNCEQIYNFQ